MITVLICSAEDPAPALVPTFLGRDGIRRVWVAESAGALQTARREKPQVVLVDREFPGSRELIAALAREAPAGPLALAVLARGEASLEELDLIEAGARSVVRLPLGRNWEAAFVSLMPLPVRRADRFPVYFEARARKGSADAAGLALVLDLAAGGALLECGSELTVGEPLELRFRPPGSSRPIVASGRVVRPSGPRRFGIQFQGLSAEAAEDLERLLTRATARSVVQDGAGDAQEAE